MAASAASAALAASAASAEAVASLPVLVEVVVALELPVASVALLLASPSDAPGALLNALPVAVGAASET